MAELEPRVSEFSRLIERHRPTWFHRPGPEEEYEHINPALFKCGIYMLQVEDETPGYLQYSAANPLFQVNQRLYGESMLWGVEEFFHADQLAVALPYLGKNAPNRQLDRYQQHNHLSIHTRPLGAWALAHILGPERMTAVVATRGYFNELTTGDGYKMLNDLADHPLLNKILPPIWNEEAQHAATYRERAFEYLDGSKSAQRAARFILMRKVSMVGEGYRGTQESDFVIRTLFASKRAKYLPERIDEAIAKLPGMRGIDVMRRRVKEAFAA